jgi:hypothetical protein
MAPFLCGILLVILISPGSSLFKEMEFFGSDISHVQEYECFGSHQVIDETCLVAPFFAESELVIYTPANVGENCIPAANGFFEFLDIFFCDCKGPIGGIYNTFSWRHEQAAFLRQYFNTFFFAIFSNFRHGVIILCRLLNAAVDIGMT